MENVTVKRISEYGDLELVGINALLTQWSTSGYQMTPEYFRNLIKNSHVLVLQDGEKIIGTTTIIPLYKLSGLKGSVEHVMVDSAYRGKGLGEFIMRQTIEHARQEGMKQLFLTVDPDREIAKNLYEKLGFIKQDTYFYELKIL